MEKEAEEFYKAASPYKPTYGWSVEEKTMKDMNAGVEAFEQNYKLWVQILDSYRNLRHGRT